MTARELVAAVFVLAFLGGLIAFTQHCALHNPPPCDPSQGYPDPCSYGITETVTDAGGQ